MHDVSVERKVGEIFERALNLKVPSPATDLFESGALDSLSFVELLLQIELAYGIRIPLQDLELANFRSIGRIAAFIRGWPAPPPEQPGPGRGYREEQCPA